MQILLVEGFFINIAGNQGKRSLFDERIQVMKKGLPFQRVAKKSEWWIGLSNVPLTQNNVLMTEVVEFEFKNGRDNLIGVDVLFKQTESKNENGVIRVY